MPEDCKEKNSTENLELKNLIFKLEEEIRILNADKKDLTDLVIKLNMRMHLGY